MDGDKFCSNFSIKYEVIINLQSSVQLYSFPIYNMKISFIP